MRRPACLRHRGARLLIVVLVGSWLGLSWATTYRLLSPSEIFGQAEVVFTARVVDVVAELRDDKALPGVYTSVTFQVEEVLKGFGVGEVLPPDDDAGAGPDEPSDDDPLEDDALESPPDDLELDFLGGEAPGDRRLLVAGSPVWRTGETVLIAAYLEPDLASPLVGFRQGLWRLSDDAYLDADGRGLGLDAAGRLTRTDLPGAPAEVLAAVRALLAGEAPAEEELPTTPDAPAEEESAAGPEEPASPSPATLPDEAGAAEEPGDAAEAAAPGEADEPAVPGDAAEPAAPGDAAEPAAPEDVEGPAAQAPVEPVVVAYRVDDSGGPLLLSDAVEAAANQWRALGGDALDLTRDSGASHAFAYGDPALFAPTTLSLTLVDETGAVTALLSPAAGELLERALQHELGLLLGLPARAPGVMSMAVDAEPAAPGEADLRNLLAVNRFAPGDLSQDGVIDFDDLLLFAGDYGRSGLNLPGDLDGNGDVDDDDLALLRQNYSLTPPRRSE